MATTDVTSGIERLEVFEEKCGVMLDSLSAFLEDYGDPSYLRVRGALQARNGSQLAEDVKIVVSAYDSAGRIIGTESQSFRAADFLGFETIDFMLVLPLGDVAKVRIYPKKG
jgi:hypothetical protein